MYIGSPEKKKYMLHTCVTYIHTYDDMLYMWHICIFGSLSNLCDCTELYVTYGLHTCYGQREHMHTQHIMLSLCNMYFTQINDAMSHIFSFSNVKSLCNNSVKSNMNVIVYVLYREWL